MAKRFTIEVLMDLAKAIGANPNKFMGTKTNITFLGKGPTKNPLFQNRLAGLENASVQNLGKPETLVNAVEDAMSFASAGKLNSIQTEILGHNLTGIERIINPPPLPMATVMRLPKQETGIASVLPKQGKVEEVFFGNPKDPRFYKSPIVDDRGRTWNFKSKLPEPGPGDVEKYRAIMSGQTGISRGIARQILLQDTRLNLPSELVQSLKLKKDLQKSVPGVSTGPDPLDVLKQYYGKSVFNFDDWLNNQRYMNFNNPTEAARAVLKEIELIPQFASGGLARVLEL